MKAVRGLCHRVSPNCVLCLSDWERLETRHSQSFCSRLNQENGDGKGKLESCQMRIGSLDVLEVGRLDACCRG